MVVCLIDLLYPPRSLRNNRTRIHKNLFVAMIIQVIIRLTLYVDQAIIRQGQGAYGLHGIDNTVSISHQKYWGISNI